MSELTRNIYEYARTGSITVSIIERDGQTGMEIVAEDNGPGIENLNQVLSGQFQSKTGLGRGTFRVNVSATMGAPAGLEKTVEVDGENDAAVTLDFR